MKIGIFTIFDAYNYGSFLQAFAMQTFLTNRGHQVYMIDVRENLKSVIAQKYFAKSISRTILKLRRWCAYHNDWRLLNIVSLNDYPELDLAVIGSDEVWNIENPSFTHATQYYGIDIKSKNIIAYAPSLGYSTEKSYLPYPNLQKGIVSNISWIGARDEFTRMFAEAIGHSNIEMVCDPTLLLNGKWQSYEHEFRINEPFMIYYSYHEDTPFKEYILRFAREHNTKVMSVGFNYKWCDNQIIVSPIQFLSLVHQATYIVTSTFHGTVFSTLYNKNFVQVHPARKAADYLAQLGINQTANLDEGYEAFKIKLSSQIDYHKINSEIKRWSEKSSSLVISKTGI